jgi:hypothetical protein
LGYFFAGKTYNGTFRGVFKKPQQMPHYMVCFRQKKIISRTFKIRGTLVFLCPKERERERGGSKSKSESKSENKSESESKSKSGKGKEKGTGKRKGKRKERERESESPGDFISKCLVQSEKSANYIILDRKERYSMYS